MDTRVKLYNAQAGFGGATPGRRDIPAADELLADIQRLGIERALVRIEEERTLDEARALVERFPQTAFLVAHTGSCNEQGYIDAALACPNIYLNLAYSASPRGRVKRLVEAVGPDKVVWGSNCNFFAMTKELGKVLGADIAEADKLKTLSGNAHRILGRVAI